MRYEDGLRHAHAHLDALGALRAPVTVLSGVAAPEAAVLDGLGIRTVFDLATAPLFALSAELAAAAAGEQGAVLHRFGQVPGGVANDSAPSGLVAFAAAPVSAIRSLTPAHASDLQGVLGIDTVGDLARWLPYRSARLVFDAATGRAASGEAEEARELVPRFGEFPTERRYYSTIVMDRVAVGATQDLATAGAVDIAPTLAADFGFSAPAVGARLTFQQSWFAHGITLGNLLHSVALAPGESTRIAVVDWSRQVRASGTESIGETESLTNSTTHNRALSEVQDAVATEVQSGFSHTESKATTASAGVGFGVSIGPVSVGGSGGIGTTKTSADSFSTSSGSRELAASMSQQVMDATQQAASSARNRRASIVKEVSEVEHEQVSTRILANYNHMHALTVQYYEVVEVYRVSTGLHEAERCLFVPMKLVDFDEATIARYQDALAAAALTRRARELLGTEFGMVPVTPVAPTRLPRAAVAGFRRALLRDRVVARAAVIADPGAPPATPPATPPVAPPTPPTPEPPRAFEWSLDELRRATRATGGAVVRDGVDDLVLPRDAEIEGVSVESDGNGATATAVLARLDLGRGEAAFTRTSIGFRAPGGLTLDGIDELLVTTGAGAGRLHGRITIEVSYRGAVFPVTLPLDVPAGATSVVARIGGVEAGPELVEHLRQNRLHYNQAIWRSFDASTVALLLSRFAFEGQPVADLIDPHPIQVAGNYLVFRMPGFVARADVAFTVDPGETGPEAEGRRRWVAFLQGRGLTFDRASGREQLVPIPTGGVFAEAVLGRSNSAEKLDATRFWNWQDSPIPLQPPEIAAINLQSRAQPIDVTPGQLGQPVLNIVNPTALPDPTGLGPMLGALQNGSMFRDMSGLAATIGLAQSSGSNATNAAIESQRLAASNMAVAAQKDVEEKRIAAQVALGLAGKSGPDGTPKTHSEMGALLNTAAARGAAGATAAPGQQPAGGDNGGGGGGFVGGDGDGGTPAGGGTVGSGSAMGGGVGGGSTSGGSLGDLAFRRALFGAFGAPAADIVLANTPPAGSGSAPQFVIEKYFGSRVTRDPALNTIDAEVTALQQRTWMPASGDFEAICRRSAKNLSLDVPMVADRAVFLQMLGEPAARFNFVGFFDRDSGELELSAKIETTGGRTRPNAGADVLAPNGSTLGVDSWVAFREIAGLSSGVSPLGPLLGTIRGRNKQYRDQHAVGSSQPLRELYLYLLFSGRSADQPGDPSPAEPVAEAMAKTLGMRVVIFPTMIYFNPEFVPLVPTPGVTKKIEVRGQVGGFWRGPDDKVRDLHEFDRDGIRFDP